MLGPPVGKNVFSMKNKRVRQKSMFCCLRNFFLITLNELRRTAYEFAERKGRNNNFSKECRLAGKYRLYGFMKIHPALCLRKPEATSFNRVLAFNTEDDQHLYSTV
jgi:hypothetical protein